MSSQTGCRARGDTRAAARRGVRGQGEDELRLRSGQGRPPPTLAFPSMPWVLGAGQAHGGEGFVDLIEIEGIDCDFVRQRP